MTTQTLILRDGQRIEFEVCENPHRYQPIYDAMATWLQDVSLDDVTNLWWMAQKRKQERGTA